MAEHQEEKKNIYRWMTFAVTIVIAVALLKLLNWVPSVIEEEGIRKFRTLDEAQAAMKTTKIAVPSYFPERIQWPPYEIFAQRKPFSLVMMHFSHADSRTLALALYQYDARGTFEPPFQESVVHVRKEMTVPVGTRSGFLTIAVCRGNRLCNSLSWEIDGITHLLVYDDDPEELVKMASSMR